MARITLVLDDDLFRQIKKKAADERRTFRAVANELLRRGLAEPARRPYRLKWQGWKATEQPGINIFDRNHLFNLMDGSEHRALP